MQDLCTIFLQLFFSFSKTAFHQTLKFTYSKSSHHPIYNFSNTIFISSPDNRSIIDIVAFQFNIPQKV